MGAASGMGSGGSGGGFSGNSGGGLGGAGQSSGLAGLLGGFRFAEGGEVDEGIAGLLKR